MSALTVDPGPWHTTKAAAPLLEMSERRVRNMCACRKIEHRRLVSDDGTRVRYRISQQAIERYMRRQTVYVGGPA